MSRISPEEVREIAVLARLALNEDEVARMTQDLGAILGHVDALRELDTSTTEPMTHAVPFDCPLRPDVAGVSLTVDEALANAPRREASFFQVPRIVNKGGTGSSGEEA
ncbi:MAG TPA: Asp-tRNA(Asn)/Glu-tRNA(Gln) amidotransferase subunit GatC [Polyangia bacterium]|jgi:aspartyl-tRNA(Asn)/glutamyl-tRNA(Gln) amidotransferase subunit C